MKKAECTAEAVTLGWASESVDTIAHLGRPCPVHPHGDADLK